MAIRSALFLGLIPAVLGGCTGYLQKFLDEDKDISLVYVGDSAGTLKADSIGSYYTVSFTSDRAGSYSLVYGANCESGSQSSIGPASGSTAAGLTITAKAYFADLMTNGGQVIICVADTANYKKASYTKSFDTAAITSFVTTYNDTYGASGAPQNSGISADFVLFQGAWTDSGTNRDSSSNIKTNGADQPYGMAIAIDVKDQYRRKFFVADRGNNRVLVFNNVPTDANATPDVVIGQSDFVSGGSATTQTGFNFPDSIALCANGMLFISDLLNHRVAGFNQTPTSNGAAMDFVLGQSNYTSGSSSSGATGLNLPTGLACMNSKLFISDRGNNRVVVFNSIPTAMNSAANFAIGQPNLSTNTAGADYTTQQNYLNNPMAIGYTGAQFILVDYGNSRVLVYNSIPTAALASPDYRIGQFFATGSSANMALAFPMNSSLSSPRALAVNSAYLAISDSGNNRLLFYSLPISGNTPAASYQLGQADFTSGSAPAAGQATFNQPREILFDGNRIWAADYGNNRVEVVALPF